MMLDLLISILFGILLVIGLWFLVLGCIVGIVVVIDSLNYLKERKNRNGKTR